MLTEKESERRLCGGCHELRGREQFEEHEWHKADAWSREKARQCQRCVLTRAQTPAGEDGQGRRASKRAAAWKTQREEQEDSSEECEGRQLEQVLCPQGCKCGNALAASGSPELVRAVQGGGCGLAAKGVMAIIDIKQGAIITCFGKSASVRAGPAGDELQSLMNDLEESESEWCQYTCAHNLQGDARFGSTRVWVVPPPDIALINRQKPSTILTEALKRTGPPGVGHLIDHSCCPLHTNAELAVRWTSDTKETAAVIVVAKRPIRAGEWVWVNYAPEDQTLAAWAKKFSCTCCQCRGVCGNTRTLGINHLLAAISDSSAEGTPWGRSWRQTGSPEVMGLRVRVNLPQGSLEGNVIHAEGPQVQVRGTLKCLEWIAGARVKTRQLVTETVAWHNCKVVEDSLTWHDHDLPAEAVQRVEFQNNARNYSDCLEETVVEMMLKWGLYGHTADQGLMPCTKRHWVASVWEYTFLLKAWDTVKAEDEPLLALLQLLSHPKQGATRARGMGPATNVKCLPVNPDLYDHIFVPIHLKRGKHWLLASIDVKARKMQLYDCSQEYGRKWRGQIHSLLWVWFLASIRRLSAMGTAIQEEPWWEIDMCNVDLQDIEDLPGLRSPGVRSNLAGSWLNEGAPDGTRLLGGAVRSRLAVLNITVNGMRPDSQRQWRWSSNDAAAPQQQRGSDCGLLTVLCTIFKARGWDMQALGSLDPKAMRGWFLKVLNSQGQWKREWYCTKCGQGVKCKVTAEMNRQGLAVVTCGKAQWGACEARRLKWWARQRQAAPEAPTESQTDGREQAPPSAEPIPQKVLGKRVGGRGQLLPRTSHMETLEVGLGDQEETGHPPTAKMERDLHYKGPGDLRAHKRGEKESKQSEAIDVQAEEGAGAAPPQRPSTPKATSAENERGRRVNHHGRSQRMGESQEREAKGLQREQQKPPPREGALTRERRMSEPLRAQETPTKQASAVRGQAIHREVFQVGVRGQQPIQAQTKCATCGLWGARLSVDTERSLFTCNTRCARRWLLNQLAAFRRQEPRQERVCGCGDMGPMGKEDHPSAETRTQCNGGLTPFSSPLQQVCAGCGAEGPTHPCARCWEVWYCTDDCARVHWQQHHTQCQRGAWCGGCGNEGQSVWCEECNEVAYCSKECREIDKRDHGKECDGRWTQKGAMAETGERQRAASYARAGGFEPLETPPTSLLEDGQGASGGDDPSADKAPAERDVERQAEELKDSIIDLVLSARQRDEIWGEVSADAQQRHETWPC